MHAMIVVAAWTLSQAGPVLHWKGDDGAAPSVAADSSGNGHSGAFLNGATTSTVIPSLQFTNTRSFVFDGVNDIVQNGSFSWPSGGPVTVSFWNNVATAELTMSSVFTVGNLGTPNQFQAHGPWIDRTFYWDYGNIAGGGRIVADYTGYFDKWTHVALVSEGNGGTFKAIYFDGLQVAVSNVSAGPTPALTGLILGAWPFSNDFHRGKVDDFRIYNRVLTTAQIQLLAAGFTEPAAPTGLTATGAPGKIQLTWTAAVGAGSYSVKRSLVSGGPYAVLATVSGTSHDDATATPGTVFYYVVTALGVNESPTSNEATAVSTPAPPASPAAQAQNIVIQGCGAMGLEALFVAALLRAGRRARLF